MAVSLPTASNTTSTTAVDKNVLMHLTGTNEESQMTVLSPGKTVYISNLDQNVTDEDLREQFKKFGSVLTCNVVRDKVTQQSKEFGFIKYEEKEMADKAVEELHESVLKDRKIRVEISKRGGPRKQTPGRYLGPQNPRDERDSRPRLANQRVREKVRVKRGR